MRAPRFWDVDATAFDYLQMRAPAAMWQAVLEQAMKDIVDGPSEWEFRGARLSADQRDEQEQALRLAAEEWVADDRNEPRRFVWVCDMLSLEPTAVRRAINEKKVGKV